MSTRREKMKKSCFYFFMSLLYTACSVPAFAQSFTAIWVNDGGDKVVKDELRASLGGDVRNSLWDGKTICLFGSRNEVLNFNVIIESANDMTKDILVSISDLVSVEGDTISSRKAEGDAVFDYRGRNIELFYIRYLQIKGLSQLAYSPLYDDRHVPEKLQLPYPTRKGVFQGRFEDRPNANKYYPDIAVPIEAVGAFSITKGENQSLWVDIYIPRDASPGLYTGKFKVKEAGNVVAELPIELEVLPLLLPDEFNAKTMVWINEPDINFRYTGVRWNDSKAAVPEVKAVMDKVWYRHFQMAKRHRISLITDGIELYRKEQFSRLDKVYDGKLFTSAYYYEGPGYGVPQDVYSVGTYGGWKNLKKSWNMNIRESMWKNSDKIVKFFDENYPHVNYFLYLLDEPKQNDFDMVEQWAQWIKENPGPGKCFKTLCTISLPLQQIYLPSVDIAFMLWGERDVWEDALSKLRAQNGEIMSYNGWRPSSGTFMIEDEGIALRLNGWIQFKHNISRWFFWASTNYKNPSFVNYETNVFQEACTFGRKLQKKDPKYGETGYNYGNGDGVLFYPGKDTLYTEDSYGLQGPIASLRLKMWRRGLQDYEYLRLAMKYDHEAVNALIHDMVPSSLWELGVTDKKDPTYVHTDISWSTDPDAWESARRKLADIIIKGLPAPDF
jgi:hypothetical protein